MIFLLFFCSPKNVLSNFFNSLKAKKELKHPPPDIHHIHLHYYPVPIVHTAENILKAPDKHELDTLHTYVVFF